MVYGALDMVKCCMRHTLSVMHSFSPEYPSAVEILRGAVEQDKLLVGLLLLFSEVMLQGDYYVE